jgi:tRNA G18 (ribose-2'-O)-methylase SpoU
MMGVVPVIRIDDADDPRLADYRHLKDVELRHATEASEGMFIVEGHVAVDQLVRSPYPVRSCLVLDTRLPKLTMTLSGRTDAPVYVAGRDVLASVVGFEHHRGVLAAGGRLPPAQPIDVINVVDRIVMLEDVTDHENIGAIFRSAAGFGFGAALLSPRCCDPLYRRSIRVSMGHVLHTPLATLEPWPDGFDEVRAAGFTIVALTPDATADDIASVTIDGRVAVLLGSEGDGLSAEALDAADRRVRIPMTAVVDSINVGAAAAIAFHHFS